MVHFYSGLGCFAQYTPLERTYVSFLEHKHSVFMNVCVLLLRSVLSPFFNEIYLMPENPELSDVNKALKEHSNVAKR